MDSEVLHRNSQHKQGITMKLPALIGMTLLATAAAADQGFYVQAGAYIHDSDFDEMEAHGNLDFPIVLELSGGYEWANGWFVKATHYSNPEAADTGLNMVGGGYRYVWR